MDPRIRTTRREGRLAAVPEGKKFGRGVVLLKGITMAGAHIVGDIRTKRKMSTEHW